MPENVKELIEEIKNLSELMLDLAYSSVLFRSKEIAKEVVLSYDRLQELEESLYEHLFAAARGRSKTRLISVIDLIESAKNVAIAAKNISEPVIEGKELHPIIQEALKESDETIARADVVSKSILKNKTLGEIKLRTYIGANVIAIRRETPHGHRWIFSPKKDTAIYEKDVLIGVGPSQACEKLRKLAKGVVKKL